MKIQTTDKIPERQTVPDEVSKAVFSLKVGEIVKIDTEITDQKEQKKFYFRLYNLLLSEKSKHKGNYKIVKKKQVFYIKRLK